MVQRIVRAARAAAAAALLSGALAAGAAANALLSTEERAVVDRVSAYLNGVRTMAGDFVQIGPDGLISEGQFVMRRPGRILFEYEPPNPTRVVADGLWVAVIDETSRQAPDRYPLSETPLALLLKADVDLADEDAIQSVERRDGKFRLTAVDPSGDAQGAITMVFNNDPIALHQWVVIDAQGLETSVVLRNVRHGVDVNMSDFRIRDPEERRRGFGND